MGLGMLLAHVTRGHDLVVWVSFLSLTVFHMYGECVINLLDIVDYIIFGRGHYNRNICIIMAVVVLLFLSKTIMVYGVRGRKAKLLLSLSHQAYPCAAANCVDIFWEKTLLKLLHIRNCIIFCCCPIYGVQHEFQISFGPVNLKQQDSQTRQ